MAPAEWRSLGTVGYSLFDIEWSWHSASILAFSTSPHCHSSHESRHEMDLETPRPTTESQASQASLAPLWASPPPISSTRPKRRRGAWARSEHGWLARMGAWLERGPRPTAWPFLSAWATNTSNCSGREETAQGVCESVMGISYKPSNARRSTCCTTCGLRSGPKTCQPL